MPSIRLGIGIDRTQPSGVSIPLAPVQTAGTNVSGLTYQLNYAAVSGATGYRIDVFTDAGLTTYLSGYNNLDVGNTTSPTVTFLDALVTPLYSVVRAYNGISTSGNSNTITTPVRYNLVSRHSGGFNLWTKPGGTTVTSNISSPPAGQGLTQADRITFLLNSGIYNAGNQGANDNFILDIYAKYVDTQYLNIWNPQANQGNVWFDIQNGIVGQQNAGYTGMITPISGGWYRCSIYNSNAQPFNYHQFSLSVINGVFSSIAGSIDVAGAQGVIGIAERFYQSIN